jgi:hypothetical protein
MEMGGFMHTSWNSSNKWFPRLSTKVESLGNWIFELSLKKQKNTPPNAIIIFRIYSKTNAVITTRIFQKQCSSPYLGHRRNRWNGELPCLYR